ncbi:CDF family Co(II)/Ni(II) efflux transporter DmeF [Sandaracinobacter sp. RS1-74]|uniref:CDF family Co(II)/Ni(II) efflux transporter DmeF n=1 Tax=Sandaracinobacteroides sayramensis TaxID=2913411 RepID=UPI001EDC0CE6|nr:CDF family Co(II)/Ni(II) efflux transporter DmeF [Sandaracinobacteroides sayramensis]MCG2841710.1 CDF family Co(II)/Ni(II) efflux transporter DmeF [Sandaracinobacteroides sayramensis]
MELKPEIDALTHEHVFLGDRHDDNARRTLWVVALTAAMMVGEIVAGSIFNSMALLADGFHMATHAGALGVAAIAYRFARRHARNRRFTFGTGKVGDLAGFASALVLALIALAIGFESFTRLFEPRSVAFGEATIVAVLGLIVNILSALLLGGGQPHPGHHHPHGGGQHAHRHDNNLRSAYLHVLADALTSVLAIAALLGGRYLGWVWLDPVMGIVGAAVIAVWACSLLRDTAAVLLDTSDPHLEAEVRHEVEGPGDARITDLHIWRLGPGAHAAIVSVTGEVSGETVRSRLSPIHELAHVTVEARQTA